ncbi:MAG: ATP-binding protein [Gammaproteobacteria bacterium]|nr:ATP-binding protein [Gammaproteobacteria bacterium]
MAAAPTAPLLICVTGVECTGKTTLAEHLARWLEVPLVREAARDYLRGRPGYDRGDVLAIARAQLEAERAAVERAETVVVADTDLTVIQVWWEDDAAPWIPH